MSQLLEWILKYAIQCGSFLTELNKSGKTIILTTHYLEEAEQLCRNVAIINKGEIIINTSMRQLVRQLKEQTYVVESINALPNEVTSDFYDSKKN